MKQTLEKNLSKFKRSRTSHEYLLKKCFKNVEGYMEKEDEGYYLIKQFNRKLGLWEVAIYTQEAFRKKKEYKAKLRR